MLLVGGVEIDLMMFNSESELHVESCIMHTTDPTNRGNLLSVVGVVMKVA